MTKYDEFIAYAMEQGWLEPVFGDDEITMKITASDDNPLWQAHLNDTAEEVQKLMDKGIVEETGMSENGEIVYSLTEYGRSLAE